MGVSGIIEWSNERVERKGGVPLYGASNIYKSPELRQIIKKTS